MRHQWLSKTKCLLLLNILPHHILSTHACIGANVNKYTVCVIYTIIFTINHLNPKFCFFVIERHHGVRLPFKLSLQLIMNLGRIKFEVIKLVKSSK